MNIQNLATWFSASSLALMVGAAPSQATGGLQADVSVGIGGSTAVSADVSLGSTSGSNDGLTADVSVGGSSSSGDSGSGSGDTGLSANVSLGGSGSGSDSGSGSGSTGGGSLIEGNINIGSGSGGSGSGGSGSGSSGSGGSATVSAGSGNTGSGGSGSGGNGAGNQQPKVTKFAPLGGSQTAPVVFPYNLSELPGKLVYSGDNRLIGQVVEVVSGNGGRYYMRILVNGDLNLASKRVLMPLGAFKVKGDMIRLSMSIEAFVRTASST